MSREYLFLDTSFALALLNSKDSLHEKAKSVMTRFKEAKIWVSESVLTEVGNALSKGGKIEREKAVRFIEACYRNPDIIVINVGTGLFLRALELYEKRPDKTSGLVDCISFIVMRDNKITHALTYDIDFAQEGFVAILRD
jgi:hypothetical protein